ncbi:MAG: hypothetical protein JW854_11120 [Actinobacteria bacterium]|nr:hypothetical protein [Actinomycetota bacterium]
MDKDRHVRRVLVAAAVAALVSALSMGLVSCGSNNAATEEAPAEETDEGTPLPPGLSSEDLEGLNLEDTASEADGAASSESGAEGTAQDQDPRYTADLAGARFTIVEVTRNDSNSKVIEPSAREVLGDYLEVELRVENVGDELVDFSQYSFRLESPGIQADDYRSYYGDVGAFGKYVDEHVISAILLDYADLTPVLYKLKKKEVLEGVFLFYDLNPQSAELSEGFSADIAAGNAFLVIRKVRGDDSGEEVEISLTGLLD